MLSYFLFFFVHSYHILIQPFLTLEMIARSDWDTCCNDSRQSLTDFRVYIENSLISWKSKKQGTLSKSPYESWIQEN